MNKLPLVSIVVVNYNGRYLLHECLSSILSIDFPKDSYEIIVVDNGSWDTSVDYIRTCFPQVIIVRSEKNVGFAGGNNLGVKHARGKYVAFLNNDTKVDPSWLKYLVDRIQTDSSIAAVNSKILFYYPFFRLTFSVYANADVDSPGRTAKSLVPFEIYEFVLDNTHFRKLVQYETGFTKYNETSKRMQSRGLGTLLIPFDLSDKCASFSIGIKIPFDVPHQHVCFSCILGEEEIFSTPLNPGDTKWFTLNFSQEQLKKFLLWQVQNAGNVVFKNGYVRDRGVAADKKNQHYELDTPFFGKTVDLMAFCGASVLLDKEKFLSCGGFDELFFMYYEDADLSLRFRENGFRIVYEPLSVVYHIHAGTSEEWSPLFSYFAERNHVLFTAKHFPFFTVCIQYLAQIFYLLVAYACVVKFGIKGNWKEYEVWTDKFDYRVKVVIWLTTHIFQIYGIRMRGKKQQRVAIETFYKELY